MTEFPELKSALHAWVDEAIDRLSADENARYRATDLGHWRRDEDGIFRDREHSVELWDRAPVENLLDRPSWLAVVDVIHANERLARQLDTFLGTARGGGRIEATSVGRRVLPRPNEVDDAGEAFERRYAELEDFLANDQIEYTVVWPLPGLTAAVLPVQLDPMLELDTMSDQEFGVALDIEIVRTLFPRERLLDPQAEQRTCARYRYNLPKLVGEYNSSESSAASQELEERLRHIEAALEESFALVLPDAIRAAGRFEIMSEPESPLSGGVTFQHTTLPQGTRLRRVQMSHSHIAELVEVWRHLNQPTLLRRNKGLALALRRLSYQAQRERAEDELLDTMIAAEALYLTEIGETDRGELRYRLALRAALWADPEQLGYTKLDVLRIMKSAYDARSALAHGGTPKPEDMKVRGERVLLDELAKTAKSIIVAGCRAALTTLDSPGGRWPPGWDRLALGEPEIR